jgi:hypothetical protein
MKQKKKNKLWNWKTKTLSVGLALIVSWIACLKIGFELKKHSNITNLPNSCFIDSMIYASQCNLLLVTNSEIWNSVYGYTFHYKDDKKNLLGHAICVFEYRNNLWVYDPNWGTSPICQIGDRKQYRQKIKLYINQHYPIIVVEDFMLNDWTYVQKIKKNKMNKTYKEVSIHLDESKKE